MIRCYLIGEDSLTIQCGNILLKHNHSIELVISPLPSVQKWAMKQGIAYLSSIKEFLNVDASTVDYIFSIVNTYVLTKDVMVLAKKGVINYHDSLLPKYAGLNSTSWAIMNGERSHGVTWHLINEQIDAGDILRQSRFIIDDEDTSLSLNLRCYNEAIKTFSLLLDDFTNNKLTPKPQNLQERTYFGKYTTLPNYGFIDWINFTAEFIERMSRALTFGHYINHIGTLKIAVNESFLIVQKVKVTSIQNNNVEPGTVLAVEENAIYISTTTLAIKCELLVSKEGKQLSIEDVQNIYGIVKGIQLPSLKFDLRDYPKTLSRESFWVEQCKKTTIHTLFSSVNISKGRSFCSNTVLNLDISSIHNKEFVRSIVLSSILIYLYRLNNYENTSISLLDNNRFKRGDIENIIYSSWLPLNFDGSPTITFEKAVNQVYKHQLELDVNSTFLSDIFVRHPELDGCSAFSQILINMSEHQASVESLDNSLLYFQYKGSDSSLQISHRFDEKFELLENMGSHIKNILRLAINLSQQTLADFCFLTPHEKVTLSNFSSGETSILPSGSLVTLFEKQVLLAPQKSAIKIGNESISYIKLWQMSESIRQYLQSLNLPNQTFIGLYLQRSPEMIAVILGILRANCVYVPLDTNYPFIKLESIINEADLAHVITIKEFSEGLSNHFLGKIVISWHCVEEILSDSIATEFITEIKEHSNDLENLAYIMFTSGTTGVPKGVMVTQKNVLNYCDWFSKTAQFENASIIDFSSSIAFDLSVPCTLAPLLMGGTIAICGEFEKTNPRLYLAHLKEKKVTHTELTPGYVELLLHYPELIRTLTDLKVLLLGADVVHSPEVIRWLELCPNHRVINEYGPTETTVSATSYLVNVGDIKDESTIPIGRPGYNSSCYVLDRYQNLCPLGMTGELYIGGMQVAKGYLGKPELTREKFINLSFNMHDRYYRTGDLARWLSSGNLQFYGREDQQVKIQGYRIELAAIETILLKHPSIHQAVVVVYHESNKKQLRAYLVPEGDIQYNEIKSFLSRFLPTYMIPQEFYITDEIPLKESEKIDFERLSKQPCQYLSADYLCIGNLNIFENKILQAWQLIFYKENISICDDFFEMGGDSLSALQIVTGLSKQFQINVPLHYIFEFPTISKLAAKIENIYSNTTGKVNLSTTSSSSSLIKLSSGNTEAPLFLIHPVGGSIFWYKQLAKYLENKYTVFGIQDLSMDGVGHRFSTLEEMACYYLEEIYSVYQGENFCLGGASFGATVAFEIAHQLINANKTVRFVGLFDGWARYPRELFKQNTMDLLDSRSDNESIPIERRQLLQSLEEYRKSLLMNYFPSAIRTDVTLFKANNLWDVFKPMDDPYNGWQPLVEGNISVHITPGNHETMFYENNVQILSSILLTALNSKIEKINIPKKLINELT